MNDYALFNSQRKLITSLNKDDQRKSYETETFKNTASFKYGILYYILILKYRYSGIITDSHITQLTGLS